VTISIVPNSLKYDGGEGEQNVRAASAGGSEVESVHTSNAETKISFVSFDAFTTTDLDSKIRDWKNRIGQNTVQFNQNVRGLPNARSFDHMSCTDSVEREVGADTVTTIKFMGDPMTSQ
jgi:hypothetical protein